MTNDVLALAVARKAQRPDLYLSEVQALSNNKVGYSEAVSEMILDLKVNIPGISIRQIAGVVGVSKSLVSDVIREDSEEEFVPVKTNEDMCSDELGALMATGREGYEDDERADRSEPSLRLVAPIFRDVVRKADQSHCAARPITLPTFPIIPLRIREAA